MNADTRINSAPSSSFIILPSDDAEAAHSKQVAHQAFRNEAEPSLELLTQRKVEAVQKQDWALAAELLEKIRAIPFR